MSFSLMALGFVGGIGVTLMASWHWKVTHPSDANNLEREVRKMTALYEAERDTAILLKESVLDVEDSAIKLAEIVEKQKISLSNRKYSENEYEKESIALTFNNSIPNNLVAIKNKLEKMAQGRSLYVSFSIKSTGTWTKHFYAKGWGSRKGKASEWTKHTPGLNLIGSPEQIVAEIETFTKDPYYDMADKSGRYAHPDLSICFNLKVYPALAARTEGVRIVEVPTVVPMIKTKVIDRIVYMEPDSTPVPDNLAELIRAQVEVEVALSEKNNKAVRAASRVRQ